MGRSYDVMEESWLSLGETSTLFLAGAKLSGEVVRSMEDLQSIYFLKNTVPRHVLWSLKRTSLIGSNLEAHVKANEILIEAGREVADFFREMLELCITTRFININL